MGGHLLQVEKVSRSQLFEGNEQSPQEAPDYSEQLTRLNDYLVSQLSTPNDELGRCIKSGLHLDAGEPEPVFRLVSWDLPARTISLGPRPEKLFERPERDCVDTEEDALERRRRANEIAVDLGSISRQAKLESGRSAKPATLYKAVEFLETSAPNILLTERQIGPVSEPQNPAPISGPTKIRFCPLVPVVLSCTEGMKQSRRSLRRKRSKAKKNVFKPPRFFHPNPRVAGKGFGYALDYPSSAGLQDLAVTNKRRPRDRMKVGTFAPS